MHLLKMQPFERSLANLSMSGFSFEEKLICHSSTNISWCLDTPLMIFTQPIKGLQYFVSSFTANLFTTKYPNFMLFMSKLTVLVKLYSFWTQGTKFTSHILVELGFQCPSNCHIKSEQYDLIEMIMLGSKILHFKVKYTPLPFQYLLKRESTKSISLECT